MEIKPTEAEQDQGDHQPQPQPQPPGESGILLRVQEPAPPGPGPNAFAKWEVAELLRGEPIVGVIGQGRSVSGIYLLELDVDLDQQSLATRLAEIMAETAALSSQAKAALAEVAAGATTTTNSVCQVSNPSAKGHAVGSS